MKTIPSPLPSHWLYWYLLVVFVVLVQTTKLFFLSSSSSVQVDGGHFPTTLWNSTGYSDKGKSRTAS